MKLSATELSDLCKKAYEGMGFALGDYEDCAWSISWLEMHGLPILSKLSVSRPLVESNPVTILFEDDRVVIIDASNNGGLIYSTLALEYACFKARQAEEMVVQVRGVHHARLIIPNMVKCVGHSADIHMTAWWYENREKHVATMRTGQLYPTYRIYSIDSALLTQEERETLSIGCATGGKSSPTTLLNMPQDAIQLEMTPDQFSATYKRHKQDGVEVDEHGWAHFMKLSKRALVESTEQSHLFGAGERAERHVVRK